MSNIKIAGIQSNLFEELNDADLVAVTGGDGLGTTLSGVGQLPGTLGNIGTPTTGTVNAATTAVDAVNGDLKKTNTGLEATLQGFNAILAGATS